MPIAFPYPDNLPYLQPNIVPWEMVSKYQHLTAMANLVYATHPSLQSEVINYFNEYMNFVPVCVDWIVKIWRDPNPQSFYTRMEMLGGLDGVHVSKRIQNMFDVSTKRLQNSGLDQEEYLKQFAQNIAFLMSNEFGESTFKFANVYRLMM